MALTEGSVTSGNVTGGALFYWLAAVGAVIGLGKLLESDEKFTLRKALGRALVSAGLGGAASLILIPLPHVPMPVVVGLACALSSLGTAFLSDLARKYLEKQ